MHPPAGPADPSKAGATEAAADPTPVPGAEPAPGDEDEDDASSLRRFAAATRTRLSPAARWLERRRHLPVFDVLFGMVERDRASAGAVLGSAVAFRLFLFFVPLLLLAVGVAGLASGFVDPETVSRAAGVSGGLRKEITFAFHQPGLTPWFAVLLGLVGVLTTGRSLSKALYAASATAWRMPIRTRAPLRTVGAVAGLVCAMGIIAILVNRVRDLFGVGAATLSFLPALLVYMVVWLAVSTLLPRDTEDPGALLPGSFLVALTLTLMHAVSELYLPDRFHRASQLYGAVGATIVTLGWFFIVGRAIVVAMELNASTFERYGSISQLVFALPGVRVVGRRSARVRRMFELEPDTTRAPDR